MGNLLIYFFRSYPRRLGRFLFFYMSMGNWKRPFSFLEWLLLFIDLTGLPEIYQFVHEIFNWNLRSLTSQEEKAGYSVFRDRIRWNAVRVNGHNTVICKPYHIAFVSFHTIHFHGKISNGIFIHELVHVWQYEKFGSAYIIRALLAQRSDLGYDYGGYEALTSGRKLLDYNFEQMAEIIKDAFLDQGKNTVYIKFINELQEH